MYSLTGINILEARLLQVLDKDTDVLLRGGCVEIVIGDGVLGVIELVLGRKVRINGLATITNAMLLSEKVLYHLNRMKDVFIVGDTIVNLFLGEFRGLFDATELLVKTLPFEGRRGEKRRGGEVVFHVYTKGRFFWRM
jgi:hypothetical protein